MQLAWPIESGSADRRWDLLAVGDPVADIVVRVGEPPPLGEKVLGQSLGIFSGGTTANVACAFARLGRPAALLGRVGDDAHGPMLRDSLAQFGVGTEHVSTAEHTASASVIAMIAPSGERAIVYMPMRTPWVREPREVLDAARIVYAMPYELAPFVQLADMARDAGALVAIDLEPAVAPGPDAMLARISRADIVFFNEAGFRAGTGEAPGHAAMSRLLDAGPRIVVVTMGSAGAIAVDRTGFAIQAAFRGRIVDTTGAGDTFNAAFLVALLDGHGLQRALQFACAAASCTVAALGARSGLPDRSAVAAVIAANAAAMSEGSQC